MPQTFSELWPEWCTALQSCNERLIVELQGAWNEIHALLEQEKKSWELILLWRKPAGQLSSLGELFEEAGRRLLMEPMESWWNARVHRRIIDALNVHRQTTERLVLRLPSSIRISRRELLRALAARGGVTMWHRFGVSLTRFPEELPLQNVVKQCVYRENVEIAQRAEPFFLLAAQAAIDLTVPWEVLRREALKRESGFKPDSRPVRRTAHLWHRRLSRNSRRAASLLEEASVWVNSSAVRMDSRLLVALRSTPELVDAPQTPEEFSDTWSRYYQAVTARLNVETAICRLSRRLVQSSASAVWSVQQELHELLQELEETTAWLEKLHGGQEGQAPARRAAVRTGAGRIMHLRYAVTGDAQTGCPAQCELFRAPIPLVRPRPVLHTVNVQALFVDSWADAEPSISEGFLQAETSNRAILKDIERARQVVEFGREATARKGEPGPGIAGEAVPNALRLLDYRKRARESAESILEQKFVSGIAAHLLGFHAVFDHRRGGAAELLVQLGFQTTASIYVYILRSSVTKASRRIGFLLEAAYHAVQTGFQMRPARAPRVSARIAYSATPGVSAGPPAFYARLFDPGPVEDLRFLVGREAELEALSALRDDWKSGRPGAAVLVGERGSGKTSILNCAASSVFYDMETVRGEFQKRIRTAEDMREFLAALLKTSTADDIEKMPFERHLVVMLEGLERTFVRQIGSYGGVLELLRLIAMTSNRILWILTANDVCFRFLDVSIKIRQYFAQTIYTMPVELADIEGAILMRHHLTGWRVHVASPVRGRGKDLPRSSTVMNSDQEIAGFPFDRLLEHSEGIFGVAFHLWLNSIERAEDGVLYMRDPAPDAVNQTIPVLEMAYLQTLLALLLHGSLTIEEYAELGGTSVSESRTLMEALADRELIEVDSELGGFRVRTIAIGAVRRTLKRNNLLRSRLGSHLS